MKTRLPLLFVIPTKKRIMKKDKKYTRYIKTKCHNFNLEINKFTYKVKEKKRSRNR